MLASFLQPHIWTANLLFIGFIQGLIVSLIAMGIVLIYRSSRVINFAVGDLGLPAAGLLSVMAAQSHFPYLPALLLALLAGTPGGTIRRVAGIARPFPAPRVIRLPGTIAVSPLAPA